MIKNKNGFITLTYYLYTFIIQIHKRNSYVLCVIYVFVSVQRAYVQLYFSVFRFVMYFYFYFYYLRAGPPRTEWWRAGAITPFIRPVSRIIGPLNNTQSNRCVRVRFIIPAYRLHVSKSWPCERTVMRFRCVFPFVHYLLSAMTAKLFTIFCARILINNTIDKYYYYKRIIFIKIVYLIVIYINYQLFQIIDGSMFASTK